MRKNEVTVFRGETEVLPFGARVQRAGYGLLAAATLALSGLASAQETDPLASLNAKASAGVGSITTTVVTIAGVVLTIGLIIWGTRHLKPKG
jgi:hypothetical protein